MGGPQAIIEGGGQLGELIRSKRDWDASPVGPPETWPESLRTVLRLMLSSRYAMWMGWGPELTFFYNDAYRDQTLGSKHPWALGRPAREVWAEIWETLWPRVEQVLATGQATWDEGLLLFLERSGYPEETYHTFSYSAAPGEQGQRSGLFCVVVEETERVVGERQLKLLRELATTLRGAKSTDELGQALVRSLSSDPREFPFSLTYLFDADGQRAHRLASALIEQTHPAAAPIFSVGPAGSPWPLAAFRVRGASTQVMALDPGLSWPPTLWGKPPTHAVVVPLAQQGQDRPAGVFIAALSPYRRQHDGARNFAELVAGQISAAIADARAFETETRRAEALAELDREKTAFFSNISHEFRTPLTLMLGPIEDALASPEHALRGENLEITHRNALRLLKLVNALLDFSRIEAGRVQAAFQPTDLAGLTRELASVFRSAVERAGLALVIDTPPLAEPVFVDREMWEKIVLNLLSNALKFTFKGEIAVQLRREGPTVVLEVRDTGTGIPAGEIPHLFERFHRVRGARARTHEGSGIGLALVSELVKLHVGQLQVKSVEGQGTTFEVRIPMGTRHLDPAQTGAPSAGPPRLRGAAPYVEEALSWVPPALAAPPEPSPAAPHADAPARERILLADDNADMRNYVARLLGTHWRVEAVADGRAALEAVRREPPALVLSDVMMPGVDGFGLLHELRTAPATRTLPVVLLSARAGDEATSEGLLAGANDYVIKPFSARELLARVASQLAIADIRRRTDHEREVQRQVMEKLFTSAPAAIALMRGHELVIEFANPAIVEMWERSSAHEVVGRPLLAALPELRGQGFDDLLRKVMTTGVPYLGSETPATLMRDGRPITRIFNFAYVPTFDASGTIDGAGVFAFDVTQPVHARKRAELGSAVGRILVTRKDLAAQLTDCCRSLIDTGVAAARIWTYDATHEVLELRASAGLEPTEAVRIARIPVSSTVLGHIAQAGKPHLMRIDASSLDLPEGDRAHREGLNSFAGYPLFVGERLVGLATVFSRAEPSDELLTALSTVADQIALGIDRHAGERFRELFIGMLGHDLRNPLNAVLMATHLLGTTASEPQKRTLRRIENSTQRMERMIHQVLDFTRARSGGGIPLVQGAANLREILDQVVEELSPAHPERTIQIEVMGSAQGLWDSDRIAQVFSNLVGNALAHGGKTTPVSLKLVSTADQVVLQVHNHGPAIPPQLLPTIFDPFRRASQVKTAGTQGLGLGLYISHQIVTAHGGTLAVQSSETEGTRFTMTLPLHPEMAR